jgi:hypothetical protein
MVVRASAMRYARASRPPRSEDRPLTFQNFIRWASLLTLGITVPILAIGVFLWNAEVWAIAQILWLVIVLAVWGGTLTVGCLVMIPLGMRRLSKRLAQKDGQKTIPKAALWDQWMDSREPI